MLSRVMQSCIAAVLHCIAVAVGGAGLGRKLVEDQKELVLHVIKCCA